MRQEIKSSSKRFLAKKVVIGNRAVRILTEDEQIDIPIPDGITEGLKLPPTGTTLKDVQISTNGGGDTLYGFFPAKGAFIVRFLKFAAREGEEPRPRITPGGERRLKDGRKWFAPDRLTFTALLEVVAGDFTSCVIPLNLDYIFERDADGSCFLKGGKKSIERLNTFLELCGFDPATETLRWTDNVLPDLEMLLSANAENNQLFQVNMKDGWVDEASELPAGFNPKLIGKKTPVEDDDDTSVAATLTTKRKTKPVVEDDDFEDGVVSDDDTKPGKKDWPF